MSKRILIMGLPGSGKTTLAKILRTGFEAAGKKVMWLNADEVRKEYNDWDFSQSHRMRELADKIECDYVIADFIAPLVEMRHNYKADWTIWMDTIDEGRYADTNKIFVPPEQYNFRITEKNAEKWAAFIGNHILGMIDK